MGNTSYIGQDSAGFASWRGLDWLGPDTCARSTVLPSLRVLEYCSPAQQNELSRRDRLSDRPELHSCLNLGQENVVVKADLAEVETCS